MGSSQKSSAATSSTIASSKPTLGAEADKAVAKLMAVSGATAVTFAAAKNGQLIYEKAYGFQDAGKTIPLNSDALMRTGSIVKPVTAAAIRKLAKNNLLSLSDHVFCTGSNAPCWLPSSLLSATTDPRAKDISIQHLISHKGGWLISVSLDAAYQEVAIKNQLQLSAPPTRADIVRYMMAKPLAYAPGFPPDASFDSFSNFGFMLLGMIVEQASQKSYTDYVQTEIMAPLGIAAVDFKAGASRLVDRNPREPAYVTSAKCISVYSGVQGICAEEMREVANWLSVGFSITTAPAMALFAQHYLLPVNDYGVHSDDTGLALQQTPNSYGRFMGDMEGLTSIVKQFPSGVSYAIFLNVTLISPELVQSQAQYDYYYNYLDAISQLTP